MLFYRGKFFYYITLIKKIIERKIEHNINVKSN